jgi:hypothetical protein
MRKILRMRKKILRKAREIFIPNPCIQFEDGFHPKYLKNQILDI